MGWRLLVYFFRQPMIKLKAHSGFPIYFLIKTLTSFLLYPGLGPTVYSGGVKVI
jgi:hypothetical protein